MKKGKIVVVGLVGLLMAGGLVLVGCKPDGCSGNGECTVTITQGTSGLYIDPNAPRSSCGKVGKGNEIGCKVAEMIAGHAARPMTYGTHGCDC